MVSLLTAPPVALACYAVAIVGTHLTGLMDQIMQVTWAGQLEHLVYLVVGCQFFVLILGDEPIRWRLSAPARWLLLAIAMAVDTFTGVVLIQATQPDRDGAGAAAVGRSRWPTPTPAARSCGSAATRSWPSSWSCWSSAGSTGRPSAAPIATAGPSGPAGRPSRRTPARVADDVDIDDGVDDARRRRARAYNEWLANLAEH